MNILQFRKLHKDLVIHIPPFIEHNVLPSVTDPTQDIPVSRIQLAANGMPLNVATHDPVFNNLKADNLSSIEKRNSDRFDVANELYSSERGLATDINKFKVSQKNLKQNEKND